MTPHELVQLTVARRHAKEGTGRAIRVAAGLSMREIADAIGASESRLSRWETDNARPTGEPAVRWAEVLAELEKHAKSVAA